jgi:hypothetical protein
VQVYYNHSGCFNLIKIPLLTTPHTVSFSFVKNIHIQFEFVSVSVCFVYILPWLYSSFCLLQSKMSGLLTPKVRKNFAEKETAGVGSRAKDSKFVVQSSHEFIINFFTLVSGSEVAKK